MNDRFLQVCRREPTDCTPIWLMRQAGRYMPEYRAIREKYGFVQMLKTPEVAAEITLQPVKALGVDAAIIFADILPVLEGLGLKLTYEKGEGPVIHNPIRTPHNVDALASGNPHESVRYTLDAIRLVKRELNDKLPLIGFSGAPFTLAAYAIEGGGSRDFRAVKRYMHHEPEAWRALMTRLADVVSAYLAAQIEAGADAVQIFDSWAGILSPFDYGEYALPYVQRVIRNLRKSLQTTDDGRRTTDNGRPSSVVHRHIPIIYFGTDMSGMGHLVKQTGAHVLGVDWRVNIDEAWVQFGDGFAVQGNLDPAALLGPWVEVERRSRDILDRMNGRTGHIFNLGHGILPETPVDQVRRLVNFVHEYSA